jgi:hypothetical protein
VSRRRKKQRRRLLSRRGSLLLLSLLSLKDGLPPLATFLPNAVVNSSLPAPSGYYQPPPIPTTNADSSASPSSSTSTLPKPSAKAIPAPTTRKSKRAEVVGGKASFLAARRKRNREAQDTNAPLTCDVCLKEKGRGGIVPVEREGTIEFSVEVSFALIFSSWLGKKGRGDESP